MWLDADTKISELSGDKKSLDDFAQLFFGMDNGSYITKTYTYDDLVTALNTVQPFDWNTFLRSRVYDVSPQVPEDGITRGGYRASGLSISIGPPCSAIDAKTCRPLKR